MSIRHVDPTEGAMKREGMKELGEGGKNKRWGERAWRRQKELSKREQKEREREHDRGEDAPILFFFWLIFRFACFLVVQSKRKGRQKGHRGGANFVGGCAT